MTDADQDEDVRRDTGDEAVQTKPPADAKPPADEPDPPADEPDPADDKQKIAKTQGELKSLTAQLVDKAAAKQKAEAEYAALTAQAAMKNAELLRLVGTPARKPVTISEFAAAAKQKGEPLVSCIIPKGFMHRLDDHSLIEVTQGVRKVPRALADHWWFRANGVVAQD